METVVCAGCGVARDRSSFGAVKSGPSAGRRQPYCMRCPMWRTDDPRAERRRAQARRRARQAYSLRGPRTDDDRLNRRLARYGVTRDWLISALFSQGNRCACCGDHLGHFGGAGGPAIDHDHSTGLARAVLCNLCNPALGYLKESPARAELAAAYLRAHGK